MAKKIFVRTAPSTSRIQEADIQVTESLILPQASDNTVPDEGAIASENHLLMVYQNGGWVNYASQLDVAAESLRAQNAEVQLAVNKVDKVPGKGLSSEDYTTAEKSKLSGISMGATANSTDAALRDRSTHTGTQTASTITGLAAVATSGSKNDVGLGNVDNTADINKPVSTGQQAAINSAANAVATQLVDGAPADSNTLNKLLSKIQALQSLVNGDDLNLDSIKELADAIKADEATITALTNGKVNKADIYNVLDYTLSGKVLDARQGKVLNDFIVALQTGKVDKVAGKGLSTEDYTTAEKNKLAGVASGATANATDAQLRDRSTHTGTQSADTIVDGTTNKAYTAAEKTKLAGIAANATANAAASTAETNAGSDAAKHITPSALAGSKYIDQSGSKIYGQTGGVANVYTLTLTPAITAYQTGQSFNVMFNLNNTGTSTININGLGAKDIVKISGPVESGDLRSGVMYNLLYNGTSFIISQLVLQFATDAETQITSGGSTSKALSPSRLANWFTWMKQQNMTFTGINTFGKVKLTSTSNSSPLDGDIWYVANEINVQKGIVGTRFLTQHANTALAASVNRVPHINSNGDFVATNELADGFITDPDITALIVAANYSPAGTTPLITPPAPKVFNQGFWYKSGAYLYFAVADNTPCRIPLG